MSTSIKGDTPVGGSIYFDLKVSNEVESSVSIRKVNASTWAFEIMRNQHHDRYRSTMRYTPPDPDHVEHLYLVMKCLGEYYAVLSKQGIWQEPEPTEQL